MRAKKGTILRGYYGLQNAGDDAFLAVSAWGARTYGHAEAIWVAATRVSQTYGIPVHPLYFAFRKSGPLNRLRDAWLSRGQGTIFGGGSNFHSAEMMAVFSRQLRQAGPGPHAALGVSIGPYRDSRAEAACAALLRQLAFVGVRDESSYERARSIAPQARIELTFDLAPLLPQVARGQNLPEEQARSGLGVALCNRERFVGGDVADEARRVENVAAALSRCARRGHLNEVTLIDFNGHPVYGDDELHNDLARRLGGEMRIKHLSYTDDPYAVMCAVARLRAVVAMRLHAAVFAFCAKTPALMLAYHEKCWEWAEMVGQPPSLVLDALDVTADDLAQGIEQVLGEDVALPTLDRTVAVERSLRNWSWLTDEP